MFVESVRKFYAGYLESPAFEIYFNASYKQPSLRYWLAVPLALSGLGIPLAAGLVISGYNHRPKARAKKKTRLAALGKNGAPIMTFPFMFNRVLNKPNKIAPAKLVGSFDDRFNTDLDAFQQVMDRVLMRHGEQPFAEFKDQSYIQDRRCVLPVERLDGAEVWVFDVMIYTNHLYNQRVAPIIPCLAAAVPCGAIEVLPWDCLPMSMSREIEKRIVVQGLAQFQSSNVRKLNSESEALKQAMAMAQGELPKFVSAFNGRTANTALRFAVKIPVTADGITEHMWLEVYNIVDNTFSGVIANDPAEIKTVKCDDAWTCSTEQIEDFTISDAQNKIILGAFYRSGSLAKTNSQTKETADKLFVRHAIPPRLMDGLGIPSAEFDQCPALFGGVDENIDAALKNLNQELPPGRKYDRITILKVLKTSYERADRPNIWIVVRKWVESKGVVTTDV